MNKVSELSQELAQSLDAIGAQEQSLSFYELETKYREVELTFVALFTECGREDLSLETRRRVAERLFNAGIQAGLSSNICRALFESLQQIGFTDAYQEITFNLIWARFLIAINEPFSARQVLVQLVARTFPQQSDYSALIDTAQELLETIRKLN